MRKIIISFCLLLILTSCTAAADKGAFFDYQTGALRAGGVWRENGNEYGVILTAGPVKNGQRDSIKIEFTSPETVSGTVYLIENGKLTATLGDMTIPMNTGARDRIFRLANMFSLKSEDITDISVDESGNTAAAGKSWTVRTDKEGNPVHIALGDSSFEIAEFESANGE